MGETRSWFVLGFPLLIIIIVIICITWAAYEGPLLKEENKKTFGTAGVVILNGLSGFVLGIILIISVVGLAGIQRDNKKLVFPLWVLIRILYALKLIILVIWGMKKDIPFLFILLLASFISLPIVRFQNYYLSLPDNIENPTDTGENEDAW